MSAAISLVVLARVVAATPVLFVADAGPVVLVELSASESAGSTARHASLLVVTLDGHVELEREDRVTGAPLGAGTFPSTPAGVDVSTLGRAGAVITVSDADAVVEKLRPFARKTGGPPIAHPSSVRVTLKSTPAHDEDLVVPAVVATVDGQIPGQAILGPRALPGVGEGPRALIDGRPGAIPLDGQVVATQDGCRSVVPSALVAVDATGAATQVLLGPAGCIRGFRVQRAAITVVSRRPTTRANGVLIARVE